MPIKEQTLYGSLITLLAYIYNLISTPLFWILIFFMTANIIVWAYSSIKNKEFTLQLFLENIAECVFIGMLVFISAMVDYTLMFFGIDTKGIFHNFIMATLIAYELGNIISNARAANLWMPPLFKEAVDKLEKFKGGK